MSKHIVIAVIGAESTGKTSLIHNLVEANSESIPVREYARTYMEKNSLKSEDLNSIHAEGIIRGQKLLEWSTYIQSAGKKIILLDASLWMSEVYALFYYPSFVKKEGLFTPLVPYHHLIVCRPTFPFVKDKIRDTAEIQTIINSLITKKLRESCIPRTILEGSKSENYELALQLIHNLHTS